MSGGMLIPPGPIRVLVATKPVDFRKGMDGLAALVKEQLKGDPFSGVIFCFRSKRADRVKLIFWDGTGLCLFAKRLEGGKFRWPRIEDGVMRLSAAQLAGLIEGLDWMRVRARARQRHLRLRPAPFLICQLRRLQPDRIVELREKRLRLLQLINRRALMRNQPLAVHKKFVLLRLTAEDRMIFEQRSDPLEIIGRHVVHPGLELGVVGHGHRLVRRLRRPEWGQRVDEHRSRSIAGLGTRAA